MNNFKPTREEILQRRPYSFNAKQINKLDNLVVAIAGSGTLGGSLALSFSRLGVKKIKLLDPEVFEVVNICKQFGATIDSIGKNKALAVKDAIKKINPYTSIETYTKKISEVSLKNFFNDVDFVVDAIEYFNVNEVKIFYEEVKRMGKWCFTGQAAGPYISVIEYSPNNSVDWFTLFSDRHGKIDPILMSKKLFPPIRNLDKRELVKYLQEPNKIPTNASVPLVGPGIVLEEIISVVVLERPPKALAPNLLFVDLNNMKTFISSIQYA